MRWEDVVKYCWVEFMWNRIISRPMLCFLFWVQSSQVVWLPSYMSLIPAWSLCPPFICCLCSFLLITRNYSLVLKTLSRIQAPSPRHHLIPWMEVIISGRNSSTGMMLIISGFLFLLQVVVWMFPGCPFLLFFCGVPRAPLGLWVHYDGRLW